MSLNNRIDRLEQVFTMTDEQRFHELCSGAYDPSLSLLENLRRVEIPPGAMPPTEPGDDEADASIMDS